MVVTDYNEQFLDKKGTDHLIDELKAYIDGIVNGNIDLSNYVTKEELQAKLDALDINIDLSSYATKEELTNAINSIVSSLKKEIPNKVSELENDSGYLTEHQNLSAYAKKDDLHTHTNKNVLDDISATDVSNWNDANVHSQTPHAPSTAQPNFIEDIKVNGASLMISDKTVNIDLSKYAKKTDIPSTDGYATTKYVDNAIANIPTTDLTGYATEEYVNNAISNISDIDLSNYYTKEETDTLIPSLSGYVTETELEAKGYLTEHQDLSNYATKDEIPSLNGYATEDYVTEQISNIPSVDLTDYAKKNEIPDVSGFITEIPEEYVTETELSAKGYLTEHQDISGKVDKVEGKSLISDTEIARLASVDNYDDTDIRTELSNKADITAIPTVDVTKSYVDTELAKKANTDHTHTTVNGHTVESDVPENAVFTDTVLEVNDADVSKTTVWSSDKTASEIASAIAGGEVDLSAYQKKNDTGLCTMAQDIVGAINEVKEAVDSKVNYDDTVVKADIAELKTKAHTHANTEVLNSITSEKIQSWNNKSEFDGNYNTLTNKPTLPVKLSDLTNDSGYITNIADDLLNYYKKSDTYSKEEVAELIGNINKLTSEIVESLPTENISTSTIYLIKDGDTNNYKQYMYISGAWAQLSDTNIDLSGYAKLTDLDTKVDKIDGKGLSTNDFTNVLKSKLDGIAEGANKTVVDSELSTTSTNPVQNAVVTTKINTLANKDGSDATGTWGINISGTAAKATADKNGNDITTTYTKQADFEKIVGNVDIIDYTSQISKNTDVVAYMWTTNIRKVGHIVTFVINITVKAVSSYSVVLGTIPEGVRPPANLSYNTLTNKGDACYVYIDSNGKFGIRKISTTAEFTANDGIRLCANYITEE